MRLLCLVSSVCFRPAFADALEKVRVNSIVSPGMTFSRMSETFGQWHDPITSQFYGLNFMSTADTEQFEQYFTDATEDKRPGAGAAEAAPPEADTGAESAPAVIGIRAGGTAERPASIINIGSVGSLKVGPKENYAYQASKSAIHWMAKGLAKRLGRDNITVNVIAPGFFESEMTVITSDEMRTMVESMVPRGRVGTPEDLAGAAIYLASRAGAYVTGSVIPVEGGLSI